MLDRLTVELLDPLHSAIDEVAPALRLREFGTVIRVGNGVAQVSGLPGVIADQLLRLPGGVLGVAVNIEATEIGVMLLGDSDAIVAGAEVTPIAREADTPVGEHLLGRVIDASGRILDHGKLIEERERRAVERPAPPIIHRAPVMTPLETGIKAIDALIPIGRGQRELILGDRQTGKTSIAVDALINQRDKGVIGIYCAIGQRATAVARVIETLREQDALATTIVVVASDADPPGLRFLTPYAATTMAEYFMEQGRDVLIVYDDLTRHARAYRELSLLLRRPPGREAYPGDIFYIHSRLLERATHLRPERGGGSLTALPIVETQAQDISAYIPTNLISITDGQIYLSPKLFHKGMLPAIDIGRSVSRVGSKAQFPAYRRVASDLKLSYAQFEELETFSRFATRLDDDTRRSIEHGRRVREVLKQSERHPLRASEQISVLGAANAGLFDELPLERIEEAQVAVRARVIDEHADLCDRIESGEKLHDDEWQSILATARASLESLQINEAD